MARHVPRPARDGCRREVPSPPTRTMTPRGRWIAAAACGVGALLVSAVLIRGTSDPAPVDPTGPVDVDDGVERAEDAASDPQDVRPGRGEREEAARAAGEPVADRSVYPERARRPWLDGSVRTEEGEPVGGARVIVIELRSGAECEVASSISGADGGFELDESAWPAEWRAGRAPSELALRVSAAGYLERRVGIDAWLRPLPTYDVVLEPGWNLRGRVVGPTGRPVPGARARLDAVERTPDSTRDVELDATCEPDGSFVLALAPETRSERLTLVADGFEPHVGSAAFGGAHVDLGSIALQPTSASLSGRLSYPDGRGIGELAIRAVGAAGGARTTTDATGEFAFPPLPAGRYGLLPDVPTLGVDEEPPRARHASGDSPVEETWDVHRIRVEVVDPSGDRLAGVPVAIQLDDARPPAPSARGRTGEGGEPCSFLVAPDHGYAVWTRYRDLGLRRARIAPLSGTYEDKVVLTLAPGETGRCRFRRRDPSGSLLEGPVQGRVVDRSLGQEVRGVEAAEPIELEPGEYALVVAESWRGGEWLAAPPEPVPFSVRAGELATVDVEYVRGGHLRVVLELPDAAVRDEWLGRLRSLDTGREHAVTWRRPELARPTRRLGRGANTSDVALPAGRYALSLAHGSTVTPAVELLVRPDEVTEVVLAPEELAGG